MSTDFRGLDPKGMPLVSIVAVSYNHEKFVEETLNSIKAQAYPNIQLIIMDDCSQDHSIVKIEEWIERNEVSCKFISHTKNEGVCKTLNDALDYCEGKYYQAISCDDIILPEKTYKQVKLLEKTEDDVAMVFSDALLFDEFGNDLYGLYLQWKHIFLQVPSGNIFEHLIEANFIPAMTVIIKKKVLDSIGYYDENFDMEDTEMWTRISKDYKIIFMNFISAKCRLHSNNFHDTLDYELNKFNISYKYVNDSNKAVKVMYDLLRMAYNNKHPSLKYMRKIYFSVTKEPRLLNYAIKFKVPAIVYNLFEKLRKNFFK